jgi:exopolysaccharide biosynthesis protein
MPNARGESAKPWLEVREVQLSTPDGKAVGMLARIDLSAGVDVIVTGPVKTELTDGADAVLTPTDRFALEHEAELAINANFFSWVGDKKTTTHADIIGLNLSDGVLVSPPREYAGQGDPAILFSRDGRAAVGMYTHQQLQTSGAFDAVAGIGSSETDPDHGGLLVLDGENLGTSARVAPKQRHPRTGIGVDASGTQVIIAVFDGRRPGHSVGVTLPELASVLIEHGVDDGVALDGGGSSAMIVRPQYAPGLDPKADGYDDGLVSNKPSDGRFRPVANNIGFRILHPPNNPSASKSEP